MSRLYLHLMKYNQPNTHYVQILYYPLLITLSMVNQTLPKAYVERI